MNLTLIMQGSEKTVDEALDKAASGKKLKIF